MKKKVCVLLAPGFEEIEAVTVVDVLRRAGIEVATLSVDGAGSDGLEVTGSHGIPVRADTTLDAGAGEAWDMVILPGGMPGSTHLRDHPGVQTLIRSQHAAGRRIGAICAAPIALAAAGVLEGRKATSYPGFEKDLRGARCSTDPVVRDAHVLTSRGPGTAFAFALSIVADLAGAPAADELRSGMLVGA